MKIQIFSLSHDTDFGTGTTLFGTQEAQEAEARAVFEEYFQLNDIEHDANAPIDDLAEKFHDSNRRGDTHSRETHTVDVPLKIKVYHYTWDTEDGIGTCIFNTAEKRDAALREVLLSYVAEGERHTFDTIPNVADLYEEVVAANYIEYQRFACGESEIEA